MACVNYRDRGARKTWESMQSLTMLAILYCYASPRRWATAVRFRRRPPCKSCAQGLNKKNKKYKLAHKLRFIRLVAKPKTMKIYLSIPITGCDVEQVRHDLTAASMMLGVKGHDVVNPLRLNAECADDYGKCMGRCIEAIINDADAVLMLGEWVRSRGCQVERYAALTYNKAVYFGMNEVPYAERNEYQQ